LERKGRLEIGLQLANTSGSRVGFFRSGLIIATVKECGTWPVSKDILTISNRELPIKQRFSAA